MFELRCKNKPQLFTSPTDTATQSEFPGVILILVTWFCVLYTDQKGLLLTNGQTFLCSTTDSNTSGFNFRSPSFVGDPQCSSTWLSRSISSFLVKATLWGEGTFLGGHPLHTVSLGAWHLWWGATFCSKGGSVASLITHNALYPLSSFLSITGGFKLQL